MKIIVLMCALVLSACAAPERRWPDPVHVPSGEDIGTHPDREHEWRSCN